MTNTEESPKRPGFQSTPALLLVVALAVACWMYFLTGAGTGMSVWSMSTLQFPPPSDLLPIADPPSPASALLMTGMWWSMMLAMMIPGTVRHFPGAGGNDISQPPGQLWFGLGYAVVWLAFSIAAACLQFIFVEFALVHGMTLWSVNDWFSAALLALAGIYQFTGFKRRSLNECRQIAGHAPDRMSGFRYGVNCLLSSFALMLLLFVGGVMNVYWVMLLAIITVIEKALADPMPFSRAVGLASLTAAAAALVF